MHRIFISHSWAKSDIYEEFMESLKKKKNRYIDLSVGFSNPINGENKYVADHIKKLIQLSNTVVFLADHRYYQSKWIQLEHKLAVNMDKNIIIIKSKEILKLPPHMNHQNYPIFTYNKRTIASQINSYLTTPL